ncbi:Hpt domain-containing protein [Magnetofaba australis]|uniref:HPt domain-containing protein n=1 Tax=Magnetofaba australis IT-1 TaxID=1434232 RepID=A0A1Y2KAQ9_9PROT|nr:Hpt domain-containing protein [Magnetofaba australis]OSM06895.1 hypothetical protein MAIT1_05054 [Magnetofaba australis IT-1]
MFVIFQLNRNIQDSAQARDHLHKLVGLAGNVGLVELSATAREMEGALVAQADTGALLAQWAALTPMLARAREAAAQALAAE